MNKQSSPTVPVKPALQQERLGTALTSESTANRANPRISCPADATSTGTQSLLSVKQGLGSALLRFCLGEKKTCANTRCWLQPICACARADLERSRKMETRVWMAIACAAAVVIVVAIIRAHGAS